MYSELKFNLKLIKLVSFLYFDVLLNKKEKKKKIGKKLLVHPVDQDETSTLKLTDVEMCFNTKNVGPFCYSSFFNKYVYYAKIKYIVQVKVQQKHNGLKFHERSLSLISRD